MVYDSNHKSKVNGRTKESASACLPPASRDPSFRTQAFVFIIIAPLIFSFMSLNVFVCAYNKQSTLWLYDSCFLSDLLVL